MLKVYRDRLMKLAKFLIAMSAEDNNKHFRMRTFLEHNNNELDPASAMLKKVLSDCYCGTVACAVGHAPKVFPKLVREFIKSDNDAYKDCYGRPDFGQLANFLFNITSMSQEFDWLFGGEWDNGNYERDYYSTSWAVADRIIAFIEDEDVDGNHYGGDWNFAKFASVRTGLISQDELDKKIAKLAELSKFG